MRRLFQTPNEAGDVLKSHLQWSIIMTDPGSYPPSFSVRLLFRAVLAHILRFSTACLDTATLTGPTPVGHYKEYRNKHESNTG